MCCPQQQQLHKHCCILSFDRYWSDISKKKSHFYINTIKIEQLKEFCDDAEVQYKKLLGYSKTRWLTLLRDLDKLLKLFKPLKSYFLNLEKCPMIQNNFFNKTLAVERLLFSTFHQLLFSAYLKTFFSRLWLTVARSTVWLPWIIYRYLPNLF